MLALIAIGLLIILVLIIYLADRVNSLEKQTQEAVKSIKEKAAVFKGPFAGLSAKKLWDAMTGLVPEGMEASMVMDVRERYELVLQKHIEMLFGEGAKDAQRGLSGDPKNTRMISTLRGQVESWLPQAQVNAIYKAGYDSVGIQNAEQHTAVYTILEEACQHLYGKVQVERPTGQSMQLMPPMSGLLLADQGAEGGPAAGASAGPAT